ncbi:hypothetical protein TNCV_906671 [Trichonephila clavipes]|nr:hypothetical protein TNCV_906671 [Trichonephila clavipes]
MCLRPAKAVRKPNRQKMFSTFGFFRLNFIKSKYKDKLIDINLQIVTSVQEELDPVDDETDEDEDNESSKGPSNAGAFSALEIAMEWYVKQSECCPTQLLLLKRIRDLAAKK